MTPEEYMEVMRSVQHTLDSVKKDLDIAIDKMQRRLETGYESQEQKSRLAALTGRESIKLADKQLLEAGTARIVY